MEKEQAKLTLKERLLNYLENGQPSDPEEDAANILALLSAEGVELTQIEDNFIIAKCGLAPNFALQLLPRLKDVVNAQLTHNRTEHAAIVEALKAERDALKQETERLKGLIPSEADRFHLGRCKIRCCPVCDAVLLKYQEQLSEVAPVNKGGK